MSDKKKTLLNENTIRRFMRLASINSLTENFVDKNKEDLEEGDPMYNKDDEEGLEPAPEEDVEMDLGGEEAPMEEPGMEPDLDVQGLVQALVAAIEDQTGVEISVEREGEEAPMEEPDMEMDMDLDTEEVPMEEPGMEPELEEGADTTEEEVTEEAAEPEEVTEKENINEDEDLVAEITKRVSDRIASIQEEQYAEELKENKINKLTDRIVERILSSNKK